MGFQSSRKPVYRDLLPSREVVRKLPENIVEQDRWLFAHELSRHLPAVQMIIAKPAKLNRRTILRMGFLPRFLKFTHPWGGSKRRRRVHPMDVLRMARNTFKRSETVESGILVTDHWSGNYFHWMLDALPRLVVAKQNGVEAPLLVPGFFLQSRFVAESLQWCGVEYIVASDDRRQNLGELVLVSPIGTTGNPDPVVLRAVASLLTSPLEIPLNPTKKPASVPSRIWVSRARARSRRLANEEELLPVLEKHGFTVVYSEELTFASQMLLFHGAQLVAGIHGAGLTNMIVTHPGAQILEIRTPADSHNNCYFALANACGHLYWYLEVRAEAGKEEGSDYILEPKSLDDILCQMLA